MEMTLVKSLHKIELFLPEAKIVYLPAEKSGQELAALSVFTSFSSCRRNFNIGYPDTRIQIPYL
jgi:hypothetical protein